MFELVEKFMCRMGRCWNCATHSTDEGIGGKCIRCGRVHGWVTRDDLRAFADRELSSRRSMKDNGMTAAQPGCSPAPSVRREAKQWYDYHDARKHKSLWRGVWASVIWVDDAGSDDLAVIHWMGGTHKVVGRYSSEDTGGIDRAKAHAERCSAAGYCPSEPGDNESYLAELNQPCAEAVIPPHPVAPNTQEEGT